MKNRMAGTFYSYSLGCACDPDRIIQDHQGLLYCGACMEPLEKVSSRELPDYDQEEILLKLKMQKKVRKRDVHADEEEF